MGHILSYPCIDIILEQNSIIDCGLIAWVYAEIAVFFHCHVHVLLRLAFLLLRVCFLKNCTLSCCYTLLLDIYSYSCLTSIGGGLFQLLIIFSLLYLVSVWSCSSFPATPTFLWYCAFQPIPWRIEIFLLIRVRALLPYCI